MNLDKLEQFLQEKILPDLDRGRPKDKAHTLDVVSKIKAIINNSPELTLDSTVLIIAGYAHDWGYTGLFENKHSLTMAEISAQKPAHMIAGAEKLTILLEDPFFDFMSTERKQRAVHLVSVHDQIGVLRDPDELILMEADSLGGLNTEVMSTFGDHPSEERFMKRSREFKFPRFITTYGKNEYERLFKKREEFYELKRKQLV